MGHRDRGRRKALITSIPTPAVADRVSVLAQASIRHGEYIFIAPSGVQKELMQPHNLFVLQYPAPKYPPSERTYIRKPLGLKPSACTPLFLAAFDRGAGCCIHTHSQWAVLVTLLVEQGLGNEGYFEV